MTTATNKATVRRYIETVIGEGRVDLVEEFMSAGIELHGTGLEPGLAPLEAWVEMLDAAFPDRQVTIDDIFAVEDRVVTRTTLTGTHKGDMQGIPATGNAVTQSSISIFLLANGRIAEGWFETDNLKMMQQLGVLPTP